MSDKFFKGLGVEVELIDIEKFSVIVETLSRIGFSPRNSKKLFQSCHILHKRGRYSIMHFKEMYLFDGRSSDISEDDILRRNRIVKLLEDWNLVRVINPEEIKEFTSLKNIRVVPHKEASEWQFEQRYTLGKRKS